MLNFKIKKRELLQYGIILIVLSITLDTLLGNQITGVLGLIISVVQTAIMSIATYEIYRLIIEHLKINDRNLSLHPKGRTTYVLITLIPASLIVIVIPILLLTIVASTSIILPLVTLLVLIAFLAPIYTYFVNKVLIENISYKEDQSVTTIFSGEIITFYKVLFIQTLLSFITLGLYYPIAFLKISKYYIEHVQFDNKQFKFEFIGSDFWFKAIGYTILTIITFGIAALWFIPWVINYVVVNTTVIES